MLSHSSHKLTQQQSQSFFKDKADKDIQLKTWLSLIIRAVEEDLAKNAPRCANRFCNKVKPKDSRWKKRLILGERKWLCELCSTAFDAGQYCEYCIQLYLETTLESTALDGKEWAQCEEFDTCNRWAHVECLARAFKKTRNEVVADDFKYLCRGCRERCGGKRRKKVYNDELRTTDTNNSRKTKRKCTRNPKYK